MTDRSVAFDYMEYGIETYVPHTSAYLTRALHRTMAAVPRGARVLDVGCGNGYFTAGFAKLGYDTVGIDLSASGIESARKNFPAARFEMLAADDRLLTNLGVPAFDAVVSTEVVEHLYAPRPFIKACFESLRPGGLAIFSTPYNGWLKNLAVAVTNKYDFHHNPLWDGGHIKFWSRKTLSQAMGEAGFADLSFVGAGRLPYLWMSMFMIGRRPA